MKRFINMELIKNKKRGNVFHFIEEHSLYILHPVFLIISSKYQVEVRKYHNRFQRKQ